MTTSIQSKNSTQSAILVNGVEAAVFDAGGIVSGIGKNKLINGNFGVNQRAVTGTVVLATGIYGHDRWKAGATGCTYSFSTVANVTTITISAGSLIQVIEGLNLMSGQVVLTWHGTAQGKIGAGAYGVTGVIGTAVGGTNLNVEFGTGTLSLAQLETGEKGSYFEQRPYGLELALCQSYFRMVSSYSIQGHAISSTSAHMISNGTPMRANPTFTIASGASISAANGSGLNVTATGTVYSKEQGQVFIVVSVASGLVAGNATHNRESLGGFSAEL